MTSKILQELSCSKSANPEEDSSGGSASAPSDDNMKAEDLVKNLPVADKTLKRKIKQNKQEKANENKGMSKKTSSYNLNKPPPINLPQVKATLNQKPQIN